LCEIRRRKRGKDVRIEKDEEEKSDRVEGKSRCVGRGRAKNAKSKACFREHNGDEKEREKIMLKQSRTQVLKKKGLDEAFGWEINHLPSEKPGVKRRVLATVGEKNDGKKPSVGASVLIRRVVFGGGGGLVAGEGVAEGAGEGENIGERIRKLLPHLKGKEEKGEGKTGGESEREAGVH